MPGGNKGNKQTKKSGQAAVGTTHGTMSGTQANPTHAGIKSKGFNNGNNDSTGANSQFLSESHLDHGIDCERPQSVAKDGKVNVKSSTKVSQEPDYVVADTSDQSQSESPVSEDIDSERSERFEMSNPLTENGITPAKAPAPAQAQAAAPSKGRDSVGEVDRVYQDNAGTIGNTTNPMPQSNKKSTTSSSSSGVPPIEVPAQKSGAKGGNIKPAKRSPVGKIVPVKPLSPSSVHKAVRFGMKPNATSSKGWSRAKFMGLLHVATFICCSASSLLLYACLAGFEFSLWVFFQWMRMIYYCISTLALLVASGLVMQVNFLKSTAKLVATGFLSVVVLLLNRLPGQAYSVPKVLNGKHP